MDEDEKRLKQEDCNEDELGTGGWLEDIQDAIEDFKNQ